MTLLHLLLLLKPKAVMKYLFVLIFLPFFAFAKDPFYSFVLPKKWEIVSTKDFASSIKIGCVAKSKNNLKPSLNLAIEKTKVSFEDYIKAVKDRHISKRKNTYTSLGYLDIAKNKAHLSQIDTKTKCGDMRILQCLLLKDNIAYIMTGVCEKGDFLDIYDQFINAFESFEIAQSPFETLSNLSKENQLKEQISLVKTAWQELKNKSTNHEIDQLFLDKKFQKKNWKNLEKFISKTFKEKGLIWHIQASAYIKSEICT